MSDPQPTVDSSSLPEPALRALAVCEEALDELTERWQNAVFGLLAMAYMGDRSQVCGWCHTSYRTGSEAAKCARSCREQAIAEGRAREKAIADGQYR